MFRNTIKLLIICFVATVYAQVYKWTDEDGNVHYSDKPVTGSSEEMNLEQSTATSPARSESERRDYQKKVLQSLTEERQRKQKDKAAEKKKQDELKQKCLQAKQRLENYRNARYLYVKDKNNEKTIYTEEQRETATKQLEAKVRRYCK